MNTLEQVVKDLQEKISKQNFSLELYGKHSIEFQVARIILNTTLETLQKSNYIMKYDFSMFGCKVEEIEMMFSKDLVVFITDTDYDITRINRR